MKTLHTSKLLAIFALSAIAISTTGCGSAGGTSNMLQHIQVKTYNQGGDLWTSMTAAIDTGNMILAGLTVPIVDPHHPGVELGSLSMQSNLCNPNGVCGGGGTLTIAVNVSQVSHSQVLDNTLPNGTMIPVGQAVNQAIVALPLGRTGARLYVAFGQNIAMLGVALPFKALDSVGQYVPGVDIFQPFANNNVMGIIGIFTGSNVNTTGLALFVDLSSVINQSPSTVSSLAVIRSQSVNASRSIEALELNEVKPSASEEQAVYYKLWKLNRHRVHLQLN